MVLDIPATDHTPHVRIDTDAGTIAVAGCSVPENADGFFGPVQDQVERYAEKPARRTVVRVQLSYFNSSTSKYLLDIFKRLEDVHAAGTSRVQVQWVYEAGDLDMQEAGQDYRELLDLPVELVKA